MEEAKMNPIEKKGQTALEYLLIVVVALVIVVMVMMFMQGLMGGGVQTGNETANVILCESRTCVAGCDSGPCAGLNAECDSRTGRCVVREE